MINKHISRKIHKKSFCWTRDLQNLIVLKLKWEVVWFLLQVTYKKLQILKAWMPMEYGNHIFK